MRGRQPLHIQENNCQKGGDTNQMTTFQEWLEHYARANDDAMTIAATINQIIARLEALLKMPGLSESDRGQVEAKINQWQLIRSQVMVA